MFHRYGLVVFLAIVGAAIFATGVLIGDGKHPNSFDFEIAKALLTLGIGLILGGATKVLLDRYQDAAKQLEEDQARHERLLADIRGVHDQAESVRLMVAAHRSARAYGEHMRSLIGCQVLLLKVKRTLDVSQRHGAGGRPDECLVKMIGYLRALQNEYGDNYKSVADCQRYDEDVTTLRFKAAARREVDGAPGAADEPPPGSSQHAWKLLADPDRFPVLADLSHQGPHYQAEFLAPLHELARLLVGSGRRSADAGFDARIDAAALSIQSECGVTQHAHA